MGCAAILDSIEVVAKLTLRPKTTPIILLHSQEMGLSTVISEFIYFTSLVCLGRFGMRGLGELCDL